jgi:hypothetical protein
VSAGHAPADRHWRGPSLGRGSRANQGAAPRSQMFVSRAEQDWLSRSQSAGAGQARRRVWHPSSNRVLGLTWR